MYYILNFILKNNFYKNFSGTLMHYYEKLIKMTIYITFRRLNTTLLTTHLAVLETLTRATSRALH